MAAFAPLRRLPAASATWPHTSLLRPAALQKAGLLSYGPQRLLTLRMVSSASLALRGRCAPVLHSRNFALLPCMSRASKTLSPPGMWLQSRGVKVDANNLKPGMMIAGSEIKGGDAKSVLRFTELNHVKPGKGGAIVKAKLLNIQTGIKHQHSFRSEERVELFEFESGDTYQFLYESNSILYLMKMDTFEEMEVSAQIAGDGHKWLQEGMDVRVMMSGGQPFSVQVPPKATYEVVETELPRSGLDSPKPAKLANGVLIKVPQFIAVGDKVLVNTEEAYYLSRVQQS